MGKNRKEAKQKYLITVLRFFLIDFPFIRLVGLISPLVITGRRFRKFAHLYLVAHCLQTCGKRLNLLFLAAQFFACRSFFIAAPDSCDAL